VRKSSAKKDTHDVQPAGERVLESLTSTSSAKPTRSDLPAAVDHRVKDEVARRRPEPQRALDNVVADCEQKGQLCSKTAA
jgi:hypothetical protein